MFLIGAQCFFVLCVLGINGKPSLSFNLPAIGPFANFGKEPQRILKSYSGRRVKNDSIRMVYFNDQTVAIVELGPKKLLLNCELIEIYQSEEIFKVLGELQAVARPVGITFEEMVVLMDQCKQLEDMTYLSKHEEVSKNRTHRFSEGRGILANNPFSLLSGIIPGTKWCGTGDIASNYFDLGSEPKVDACCRAHDLCPVKIRAYSQKYNLTNNSLYTKSHCKCDENLFQCLKSSNAQSANIMGNIYFNLVQVPCLEDTKLGRRFRNARNNF
ncbi:hypothetical protein NQ317_000280 [Molorchus minor]|uniref:phospholipase A2 n=1 Tax=Molorchus minor TaxID=1323400 RepID=A0ABQ9JD68_9CUCU|nr:hypothetical protein NQ317_000280 [Molorchus minor]